MKTVAFGSLTLLLTVTACSTQSERPVAEPTPAPASSSAPPAPPAVTPSATAPARPTLADLPRGRAPRIGWVDGFTYHGPDGRRVRLPQGKHVRGLSGVTAYDGGFLVADTRIFEATNGVVRFEGGRTIEIPPATAGRGVSTRDGSRAAWGTFPFPDAGVLGPSRIHLWTANGVRSQALRHQPNAQARADVVGIIADEVVFNRAWNQGAFVTDLDRPPRRIPGMLVARSVAERTGLIAGTTGTNSGVVVHAASGEVIWERRRTELGKFSPDEARVLARVGRQHMVLDARDGSVLRRLPTLPIRWVDDVVWETSKEIVVVGSRGNRSAVLRITADDRVERATAVRRVGPDGWPVLLLVG